MSINIKSLTNLLEANVRDELASKHAALALIERQEAALACCDAEAFEGLMLAAKKLVEADGRRDARRRSLLKQLGEGWQVASDALTLGSVAARLGDGGSRLSELRAELREVVATVIRRNRRLSVLIGMHRRLNGDILQAVLGADGGEELTRAGTLVNAQA